MKANKNGNKYRIRKMIDGKQYSINFDHEPSQREIDRELAKIVGSVVTMNNAPNKGFKECAENYIALKDKVLSVSTIRNYKSIINNIPDWFLEKKLNKIDQLTVQQLVNEYSANHSPKSVRNLHGFVASVLSMYNPQLILKTTLPQKENKDIYIPTTEDIQNILDVAEKTRYYVPLSLACYGLRRSEILALNYPDDFNGNEITINKAMVQDADNNYIIKTTKTTESKRTICIDDELLNRIKEQGYVYKGHPDKINEYLQKVQKRLGIEKFSLHKMRHYFASEMSRVLPESDWLALGGWATPSIAKRVYRHDKITHDQEMRNQVAELMKKKRKGEI